MPLTARETVAIDTRARLATSRMLTAARRRFDEIFFAGLIGRTIVRFSRCFSTPPAGRGELQCALNATLLAKTQTGCMSTRIVSPTGWRKAFPRCERDYLK